MVEPLIRPSIPSPRAWEDLLHTSEAAGQYSNFGPVWTAAADYLSRLTDRIALPCSNGTDALVVALETAQKLYVSYEAFTFQATAIAAKRYLQRPAVPLRTGQAVDADTAGDTAVIRTIPFGSSRSIRPEPDAQLIIDAAGAFGPDAFDSFPKDAIITCSFHATKNFPIGEGGCVFLPKDWTKQVRIAKATMNFGLDFTRTDLRYLSAPGNYKLDELHCALLLKQLERADFFRERSKRMAHESRLISAAKDCSLPYSTGAWQSLVVVAHRDPDALVAKLAASGYVARRMYHPFIKPDLLAYEESRLVAVPSDIGQNKTFWSMVEVINS